MDVVVFFVALASDVGVGGSEVRGLGICCLPMCWARHHGLIVGLTSAQLCAGSDRSQRGHPVPGVIGTLMEMATAGAPCGGCVGRARRSQAEPPIARQLLAAPLCTVAHHYIRVFRPDVAFV